MGKKDSTGLKAAPVDQYRKQIGILSVAFTTQVKFTGLRVTTSIKICRD
jgi:hypothetical protein